MNVRQDTADAHARQKQQLTNYQPASPDIPTDYNCPSGHCATATPPLPPGIRDTEGFSAGETPGTSWLALMVAAALLFIAATRLIRNK